VEVIMIKLVVALALAAIVVSPALSQSPAWQGGERSYEAARTAPRGSQARQKPARRAAVKRPCAAYVWGSCMGWDPDPNVRSMMQMDSTLFDD
jgi:hypothetical protein